jgi:hypothetical protein
LSFPKAHKEWRHEFSFQVAAKALEVAGQKITVCDASGIVGHKARELTSGGGALVTARVPEAEALRSSEDAKVTWQRALDHDITRLEALDKDWSTRS